MKWFFAVVLLVPILVCAADPEAGKKIVLGRGDGNCLLCHVIPGADRPAGNVGPSLAGVGTRFPEAELRARIADAARFNPATVMPPYGRSAGLHAVAPPYRGKALYSAQDIENAAAFLFSLK